MSLHLTGDGEKTLTTLHGARQQTSQKRLGTLSETEVEDFTRLCHKLLDG